MFVLTAVGSGVCGSLRSSLAEDKAESDILCTDWRNGWRSCVCIWCVFVRDREGGGKNEQWQWLYTSYVAIIGITDPDIIVMKNVALETTYMYWSLAKQQPTFVSSKYLLQHSWQEVHLCLWCRCNEIFVLVGTVTNWGCEFTYYRRTLAQVFEHIQHPS